MREAISNNHYSTDGQLEDAISYLEHNIPEDYARFLVAFPEWPTRTMGEHSSWFDTDAMGVDQEWGSWAIDWVEQNTNVQWDDGEPYADDGQPDEDDPAKDDFSTCSRHGTENSACNDPDCIRERGGSVLAEELRQAEDQIGTY